MPSDIIVRLVQFLLTRIGTVLLPRMTARVFSAEACALPFLILDEPERTSVNRPSITPMES